jgi:tetratricopeptide (TPR) repeat protein
MSRWEKNLVKMEAQKEKSIEFTAELLNYQYGYVAWCIWQNKMENAKYYMTKAEKNVTFLENKGYNPSLMNAYKAAFTGLKISFNKFKAPYYGLRCVEYAKQSIRLDDKNPFGHLQTGNIYLYAPTFLGGSRKEAMAHYLKAVSLMESDKDFVPTDWNYMNLLTTVAKTYNEMHEYENAARVCKKILQIAPTFWWVKNELYPSLLKKIKP